MLLLWAEVPLGHRLPRLVGLYDSASGLMMPLLRKNLSLPQNPQRQVHYLRFLWEKAMLHTRRPIACLPAIGGASASASSQAGSRPQTATPGYACCWAMTRKHATTKYVQNRGHRDVYHDGLDKTWPASFSSRGSSNCICSLQTC